MPIFCAVLLILLAKMYRSLSPYSYKLVPIQYNFKYTDLNRWHIHRQEVQTHSRKHIVALTHALVHGGNNLKQNPLRVYRGLVCS